MREVFVVYETDSLNDAFLAEKSAVVIDVLRATSSMIAALDNGAHRIIPTIEVEEARALKRSLPEGSVVLGGERGGLMIDGFDLGNTPQDFSAEKVAGRTVVMTTTNGTRAILMALGAEKVYIAALTNAAAMARVLTEGDEDVVLVGSGTERRISWEDSLCAGAIIQRLMNGTGRGGFHLTDSALIAAEIWKSHQHDPVGALRLGRGGRNVVRNGVAEAFESCGAVDSINLIARVNKTPLEIVPDMKQWHAL